MAFAVPAAVATACALAATGALRSDWRPLFAGALLLVPVTVLLMLSFAFVAPLAAIAVWLPVAAAWRLRPPALHERPSHA
jgi:hypothetical protein